MKLAILDDYQGVAFDFASWEALQERGVHVTVFREHLGSRDNTIASLKEYDIIVAMRERTTFDEIVLKELKSLRLLVTTAMSNAAIDYEAASRYGIKVCGTSSSVTAPAELTWALIMAASRYIISEQESLRTGSWQSQVGTELHGKTIGIVGLGRIGRRIAQYAECFGMKILAWSPNMNTERAESAGAVAVSKKELFRASHFVSLHLRLSAATERIVGEEELRLLGPHGILINTARAGLVDNNALVRALSEKMIRSAAIDVFDEEPISSKDPLLKMSNVLLTPHIGYVARDNYRRFYTEALEDVEAWLQGRPVRVIS